MVNPAIRRILNPSGPPSRPVLIGGIEVWTLESQQSSGVDAPKKSIEKGAEITQRNVLIPESGTLSCAVRRGDLPALKQTSKNRGFVPVTTPEGSVQECVIESVDRTRDGSGLGGYRVDVSWSQVFTGTVGVTTLVAVTRDGKKGPAAGSGPGGPRASIVDSETKRTNNGPRVDVPDPRDEGLISESAIEEGAKILDGIADWAVGGGTPQEREQAELQQQSQF